MKKLVLRAEQMLYTEDMANQEVVDGVRDLVDEIRNRIAIRNPVYVMRFSMFLGRYAIFQGNKRTRASELTNLPIKSLEIENARDFQRAQRDQPSIWHNIAEEEFMRHNGQYFFMDLKSLKQRGLLCSDYHRARRRICEAVYTLYPYLFSKA